MCTRSPESKSNRFGKRAMCTCLSRSWQFCFRATCLGLRRGSAAAFRAAAPHRSLAEWRPEHPSIIEFLFVSQREELASRTLPCSTASQASVHKPFLRPRPPPLSLPPLAEFYVVQAGFNRPWNSIPACCNDQVVVRTIRALRLPSDALRAVRLQAGPGCFPRTPVIPSPWGRRRRRIVRRHKLKN